MNNYYMEYMTKKQLAIHRDQEAMRTEMLARGINKGITDIWFGQQEFTQKTKDDDEFADQFLLPRENLRKTKDHEKRVKMLRQQAREQERENRALEKLREEHGDKNRLNFGEIKLVHEDSDEKEK